MTVNQFVYVAMQFISVSALFLLVTEVLAQGRDPLSSENRRLLSRAAPEWSVITELSTDGSIVFPVHKPGRRPSQVLPVTTTKPLPLPENLDSNNDVTIPVSLFLNKSITNLEEFMKNLVLKNEYRAAGFGGSVSSAAGEAAVNFLRSNSAARNGGLAAPANCEPQDTPVELERPDDPSLIYFPRCTKVQRCGGCCQHDLLMCVPTNTEAVTVNVMKARFIPETNSFQPEGLHPIALEKHLTCECQCRVTAEDCNKMQVYRREECRCICTNEHESKLCVGANKFWDPQTCKCECRNNPDCSTGSFFDEKTCTCQPERASSVIFPSRRSGLQPRGQVPYELTEEEAVVGLDRHKDENISYSAWYLENVMRKNPTKNKETLRE